MGNIKFNIPSANVSAQIGDKIYCADLPVDASQDWDSQINLSLGSIDDQSEPEKVGGFYTNQNIQETLHLIGTITKINVGVVNSVDSTTGTEITCNWEGLDSGLPDYGHSFMFFIKDTSINSTSIPGYYASAMFECNSRDKAEIFATSCNIEESSK